MDFCLSDTFIKPSLWLMVNPNIVCPLQYKQDAELQPEPVQEVQTPQLEPAERHPPTVCSHMLPSQENLLHSVPSSAGYNVMIISPISLALKCFFFFFLQSVSMHSQQLQLVFHFVASRTVLTKVIQIYRKCPSSIYFSFQGPFFLNKCKTGSLKSLFLK